MKDIKFPGKYIATKLYRCGDYSTRMDIIRIASEVIRGLDSHEYFPEGGDEIQDLEFAIKNSGRDEEYRIFVKAYDLN